MKYLLLALALLCGNAQAARCAPFEDSADYLGRVDEYSLTDTTGPYLVWSCFEQRAAPVNTVSRHCLEGSWSTLTLSKLGDRMETIRKSTTPIAAFHASVKRHVTDPASPRCAALLARIYTTGQEAAAMPIFGDNTAGPDEFPGNTDRALLDRFAIPENGTADSISVYIGASSTAGANVKGLIYTDSGSAPASLVAASASAAAPAGGGWVTMAFSGSPALVAGNYWIGLVADSFQAYYGEDATGSAPDVVMANGTLSFSSPPATWPGTDASYGVGLDVYVTYTAAGGTPVAVFANQLRQQGIQ